MTLPSSPDSISFSQIEDEFGNNATAADPRRTLGKYRISQNVGDMSNLPLDTGIAQGNSPIKFSQFRGKRLNIILNYNRNQHYETPSPTTKYNDGGDGFTEVVVVGGFKQLPSSTSGKKVYIHVSAIIGGRRGNRKFCSLRTGTWPSDTELHINIGHEGGLIGAGGKGGQGGSEGSDGENGGDGSSALGIQHEVTELVVQSGGLILAGGGGGGGGGGAENDTHGAPGGTGGDGAGASFGTGQLNTDTGQFTGNSGESGAEGDSAGSASGGGGGGGGSAGGSGGEGRDGGQDGNTEKGGDGGEGSAGGGQQFEGNGGTGGNNGYAILRENINYINNSKITGTISGDIGDGEVET